MKALKQLAIFLSFVALLQLNEQAWCGDLDFDAVRQIAVQNRGRVKPLDSVARETIKRLCGKQSFSAEDALGERILAPSNDPVDTLLSLMFENDAWMRAPLIRIKSAKFKMELGLAPDERYFSAAALSSNEALVNFYNSAVVKRRQRDTHPTQFEEISMQVMDAIHILNLLRDGKGLALVPPTSSHAVLEEAEWTRLQDMNVQWESLKAAYLKRDSAAFAAAVESLAQHLRATAPDIYPSERLLNAEIHYNQIQSFRWTAFSYMLAFILWLGAIAFARVRQFKAGAWLVMVSGLLLHTYGFYLRVIISGRAPVTNMYESMLFMAWGAIFFAIIFEAIYRSGYFGLASSLAAGLVVMMTQVLPIDSSIGVLVPVLRSNFWLTVHVLTSMLSYSAFAVGWVLGHIIMIQAMIHPKRLGMMKPLCNFVYRVLQAGVLLLLIGTILGGVWANYSWGRFWGWDPKETWALICLLGYLAVLHARHTSWIKDYGMAVWAVISFILVVMCYYGVNYLLPVGLHSYSTGQGRVVYAAVYVIADLLFVAAALWRWQTAKRVSTE
jgi:cytochrome c-type biogenesis protein CcsB